MTQNVLEARLPMIKAAALPLAAASEAETHACSPPPVIKAKAARALLEPMRKMIQWGTGLAFRTSFQWRCQSRAARHEIHQPQVATYI